MEPNNNNMENLQENCMDEEVREVEVNAGETACEAEPVAEEATKDAAPEEKTTETTDQGSGKSFLEILKTWLQKAVKFLIKYRKWIILLVILACIAAVAMMVIVKSNNKKNYYESLGQTVTEMKKISEFCTAKYIGEVMMQDEVKKFLKRKNIVLIVKGRVRAGFDLSKMEVESVGDTAINLMLPPPKILDIITNPTDIRIFSEKGDWSQDEVNLVANAGRLKLLQLVLDERLLATAEENGKRQITSFFTTFGLKRVNIDVAEDTSSIDFKGLVGDSLSGSAIALFAE